MKSKKLARFLCMALILCLCVSLLPSAAIAAGGAYTGKTVVMYTGNLRGDVDKLPQIAAAKKSYEDAGAEVVLLDAGNYLQGTQYTTFDAGKTFISLMSQTGYSVLSLGRYDFSYGTGTLGTSYHGNLVDYGSLGDFFDSPNGKFYAAGSMKLVSANITGQNENFFSINPSQTIITTHGIKIGVFGLTNQDTMNYTLGTDLSGMSIGNASSAADAQVTALTGNDVIIGLSNAGVSDVKGASMIDVSENAGFTIGALVIDNTSKAVTKETVTLSGSDSTIGSAVSEWKAQVHYATPVVKSSVTLNGATEANRGGETNLGDLWADAIRWYVTSGNIVADFSSDYKATFGNAKIYVDSDHVVALWNGGNLREYLNTGDVTMTDIERVLPYPNYISVTYLKGSELLEQLEACSQGLPYSNATSTSSACASFMQVAGINYTVKTGIPYNTGDLYQDSWYKLKDGKSNGRVTITSVNGKKFDPDAMYCVVTHDKNSRNGMDASYVLANPQNDVNHWSTYTNKDVCEIVLAYIQSQLGGNIGGAYASPQGRIVITSEGTTGGNTTGGSKEPTTKDSYTITVTQAIGGTISPSTSAVNKGESQTFTITAAKNYKISDVLVDGASVGAVGSYSFSDVSATHTISAVFASDGTWENPYTDVDKNAWYFSSIEFVSQKGIMKGASDSKFEPETQMTRGMFVTMLYRLAGSPSVTSSTQFDDVTSDTYYFNAVAWAIKKGITTGVSGSSFAPDSVMSRQEMATFIYRYIGSPAVKGTLSFSDSGQVSDWATNALLYCVQNNLMNGVGDTAFSPLETANRAMGAAIMSRIKPAA